MATGPEQYAKAEECLDRLPSLEYGSHEAHEQLLEAQVRATLALAAATAPIFYRSADAEAIAWARVVGTAAPYVRLTWWLDDGQENADKPQLYTTEDGCRDAAVRQFERDNPFPDLSTAPEWLRPEDADGEDDDIELAVRGHRTGIIVRPVRPKDGR